MYAERESNSGNWTHLVPAKACLDDLGGLLSLRSLRGPKPDFRNLPSLFSEMYLWGAIMDFEGHLCNI